MTLRQDPHAKPDKRPEMQKLPCIFPCNQGISGGDRFVKDCFHRHYFNWSEKNRWSKAPEGNRSGDGTRPDQVDVTSRLHGLGGATAGARDGLGIADRIEHRKGWFNGNPDHLAARLAAGASRLGAHSANGLRHQHGLNVGECRTARRIEAGWRRIMRTNTS